jgi:hypothetical protein
MRSVLVVYMQRAGARAARARGGVALGHYFLTAVR